MKFQKEATAPCMVTHNLLPCPTAQDLLCLNHMQTTPLKTKARILKPHEVVPTSSKLPSSWKNAVGLLKDTEATRALQEIKKGRASWEKRLRTLTR